MGDGEDHDKKAILKVIEDETAAFFNKDYEGWAQCWVHSPHVRRWVWTPVAGIGINEGWEKESSAMKRNMERFSQANRSANEVRRDRLSIQIGADTNMRRGPVTPSTEQAADTICGSWKSMAVNGKSLA